MNGSYKRKSHTPFAKVNVVINLMMLDKDRFDASSVQVQLQEMYFSFQTPRTMHLGWNLGNYRKKGGEILLTPNGLIIS